MLGSPVMGTKETGKNTSIFFIFVYRFQVRYLFFKELSPSSHIFIFANK